MIKELKELRKFKLKYKGDRHGEVKNRKEKVTECILFPRRMTIGHSWRDCVFHYKKAKVTKNSGR